MSTVKDVTEHGVAITLAAFGLVGAPATVSVSLAALAAIGFQSFRSSRNACEAAVAAVAKEMTRIEDPETLREVDRLLRDTTHTVDFAPGQMPDPADAKTLDVALVDRILALVPTGASANASALLRILFQHAVAASRYTTEIHRAVSQDLLWEVFANVRAMRTTLENLNTASRDQLENLATRFRIPDAFDLSQAQLRAELEDRAHDYRALRAQVDALDDRTTGLGNLKAAAQDALDRLDFEEAAALFAHIRTTQQEQASDTAEAEADTLLILDRVEEARDVLLDAADAFKRRDRVRWIKLKHETGKRLSEHGLKRAGAALSYAAEILRTISQSGELEIGTRFWFNHQNRLGNSLMVLGKRGNDSNLHEAIDIFRAALKICDRKKLPYEWRMTQNNLGNALEVRGKFGKISDLVEALAAYQAALNAEVPGIDPYEDALNQNNLGLVITTLSIRGHSADLRDAINAFDDALKFFDRDIFPSEWAMVKMNYANACLAMVSLESDGYLARAAFSYEEAMDVYTFEQWPIQWSSIQDGLGTTYRFKGVSGEPGALQKSANLYKGALKIRTRKNLPEQWATTQFNLSCTLLAMSVEEPLRSPEYLISALTAVNKSLEIYLPARKPLLFDRATALRDHILAAQNAL